MNARMKLLMCSLLLLMPHWARGAEYIPPSKTDNARILIENALFRKIQGQEKYAYMTLVAKDDRPLHEGQVYSLFSLKGSRKTTIDGSYDEHDEILFINDLLQESSLRHQTTLRLVNSHPMEFAVIENTSSLVNSLQKHDYKPVIYQSVPQSRSFRF